MSDKLYDLVIVGGGIVGVATAFRIQEKHPVLKIVLFEKEEVLANHQTGNNSGVIHSGLYYSPGSFKAKYCVEGRHQLVDFVKEHNVAHDICGKVVVAVEDFEKPYLEKIYNNGIANNTEGVEKISGSQVAEIEPHVKSIGGIWVPCTGIVDFRGMTNKMADLIKAINPNSEIKLGHEVKGFAKQGDKTVFNTSKGVFEASSAIFCGGLQADRLAKKDKLKLDMATVGFRGDYYVMTEKGKDKVKNLIYPVPNPAFPFLGVHFTRMTSGEVECGPNAVFTFKREGYKKTDFDLKDTVDALTFPGTSKLMMKHWKFGLNEYRRAFSKKRFLGTLQRLIPSLEMDDIDEERAGVRAMSLGRDGQMIEDFKIEYKDDHIHVLNAPSPAATACLAIGKEVCRIAEERFNWN